MSPADWQPFCLGLDVLIILQGNMCCLSHYVGPGHAYVVGLIKYGHNLVVVVHTVTSVSSWSVLPYAWWLHQVEAFSAFLAICAGNSPVSGEFPAQRSVTRSFDVFIDPRLNKRLSKHHEAGDLECHRTHYDVTYRLPHRQKNPVAVLAKKSCLAGTHWSNPGG